jgi:membrane protease YdiL (CAAX protease family)
MSENRSYPVENIPEGRAVQRFSLSNPILVCIVLFIIALFFRWIDGFVFRLDERLGELILTKSLGFALVLAFVWATGRSVRDIGLHASGLGPGLLVGAVTTALAFVVGYGADILLAVQRGVQPTLRLGAVDPKIGVAGGFLFGLWLLLGNFVNSFMEEGLFRGVMGRLARRRWSFWRANVFQAIMFGIWHLPWVLKYYQLGEIETGGEIAMAVVSNSVPMFLIGLVYGYLYLKTGSLWAPWIAHTLSNSVLNFLHVVTIEGMDTSVPLRMMVYLGVMFCGLFWVRRVARNRHMPEARPWD